MLKIFADPNFQEKALLLLITASVSGFLVPFILKQVEVRKSIEQKLREAQLARQAKIIDSQADLLDNLAKALWEWRYAAMKVTYYGSQNDAVQFEAARNAYSTTVWGLLSQIRFQTSRTKWLISDAASKRLVILYHDMIEIDSCLYEAGVLSDPVKRSLELGDINQRIFGSVTDDIDSILFSVAKDAMLSADSGSRERP